MRRIIEIKRVIKTQNRIEVEYTSINLSKYIDVNIVPFFEYSTNIENVPESIAVIPFIANLLPMCFVLDIQLIVPQLDLTFFNAISEYRFAYQTMVKCIEMKGDIVAHELIENRYVAKEDCLLFSGGVDAVNSLCSHEDTIRDCITIWGADVRLNNKKEWDLVSKTIVDTVNKFKKRWLIIKTNFREYIKIKELNKTIRVSKDEWWHGFQHGVALLGATSPYAYIHNYRFIYIASSYTRDFLPLCASDPRTDSCFKVGSSTAIHDGFEFDRCEKLQNIAKTLNKKKISVDLHVCWEGGLGCNCGKCEKCIRTFLGCRSANVDYKLLGIPCPGSPTNIYKFYKKKVVFTSERLYNFKIFRKNIIKNYPNKCPGDLEWILAFKPRKNKNALKFKIRHFLGSIYRFVFRR